MFKHILFVATAVVAAIIIPGDAPDPSQVSIQGIAYAGSGCPANSVGQFLSTDASTFTLIFSSFTAEVGATTQPMDARKFCQINLDLHYPQGFQFSVLSTTFRGFVSLDKGVTATLSALYYFSGPNQNQVRTSTMFYGPEFEPYTAVSNVGFTSLVWSPCGANWPLNVQTAVAVVSDNATAHSGFIENDSADGNIKFVAGIQWRRCNPAAAALA